MAPENGKTGIPYISFRTFLNFLDRLHQAGFLPQKIDRHYWGDFLGGSVGVQLTGALRFLHLINEKDEPTPTLAELVDPAQRKATLRQVIQQGYAPLFNSGLDLSRTTLGHVADALGKTYKVEGDTRRKGVTFLIHAAQYAELPLSSVITSKAKPRRAAPRPRTGPRTGTRQTSPNGNRPSGSGTTTRQRRNAGISGQAGAVPNGSNRSLTLPSGSVVTVSVTSDVIRLPRTERDFVLGLIDQLEDFEQSLGNGGDEEEYDFEEDEGEDSDS